MDITFDSPHIPVQFYFSPKKDIKMRRDVTIGQVWIGHSNVIQGLEFLSHPEVLGQHCKPLGARSHMVLQQRQVMLPGIFPSLLLFFFGEPSPFTIDGHLKDNRRSYQSLY